MSQSNPSPVRGKKRGAQPGNRNALKHGIYSRHFKAMDVESLEQMTETIDAEIAALRVASGRVFGYADALGRSDPLAAIGAWGVFTKQVNTINGLLRTRSIAAGKMDDAIAVAAIDAIVEVAREKGIC